MKQRNPFVSVRLIPTMLNVIGSRTPAPTLRSATLNMSAGVRESVKQDKKEVYEMSVDYESLVDEILSDSAKEFAESRVGKDEYYFSEHSKNLDIIDQFEFDMDWIKAHPELLKDLKSRFSEYAEDLAFENDLFEAWLYGHRITLRPEGYQSDLVKELRAKYQSRITETHKCEVCGVEISEKHPRSHPNSLSRIGFKKEKPVSPDDPHDSRNWDHKLYCRKCFDEHTKLKK